MTRLLTATFIIHDPQPVSGEDWENIQESLEDAGNYVGLELMGFGTAGHPEDISGVTNYLAR